MARLTTREKAQITSQKEIWTERRQNSKEISISKKMNIQRNRLRRRQKKKLNEKPNRKRKSNKSLRIDLNWWKILNREFNAPSTPPFSLILWIMLNSLIALTPKEGQFLLSSTSNLKSLESNPWSK